MHLCWLKIKRLSGGIASGNKVKMLMDPAAGTSIEHRCVALLYVQVLYSALPTG